MQNVITYRFLIEKILRNYFIIILFPSYLDFENKEIVWFCKFRVMFQRKYMYIYVYN